MINSFLIVYLVSLETIYQTEPYLTLVNLKMIGLNFDFKGRNNNFYSQSTILDY